MSGKRRVKFTRVIPVEPPPEGWLGRTPIIRKSRAELAKLYGQPRVGDRARKVGD